MISTVTVAIAAIATIMLLFIAAFSLVDVVDSSSLIFNSISPIVTSVLIGTTIVIVVVVVMDEVG